MVSQQLFPNFRPYWCTAVHENRRSCDATCRSQKLDGVIVGRKTSVTPFTYAFVVRANEELYRRDACVMLLP